MTRERRIAAVLAIATWGCASGDRPDRAHVDPNLVAVETAGSVRLLVYIECSPEHCWSAPYLQWLDNEHASVVRTKPVQEMSLVTIGDIESVWVESRPRFRFRVAPSHGGFEPYDATIVPGEPGSYTIEGEPSPEE